VRKGARCGVALGWPVTWSERSSQIWRGGIFGSRLTADDFRLAM
jgi:hypothetical protein